MSANNPQTTTPPRITVNPHSIAPPPYSDSSTHTPPARNRLSHPSLPTRPTTPPRPHQLPTLRRSTRLIAPAPTGSGVISPLIPSRLAKPHNHTILNLGENPFAAETPAQQMRVEDWRKGMMSWIEWYPDYPDPEKPWGCDKGSGWGRRAEVEAAIGRYGSGRPSGIVQREMERLREEGRLAMLEGRADGEDDEEEGEEGEKGLMVGEVRRDLGRGERRRG